MRRSRRRVATAAALVATAILVSGCAGGCPAGPTPNQMHQAHVGDYALGLMGVMFAASLIGWLAGLPMVVAFAAIQGSSNGDCGPTAAGTQSFINSVEVLAAALLLFGIAFSGLCPDQGVAMVAVGVALLIPTIFVALP